MTVRDPRRGAGPRPPRARRSSVRGDAGRVRGAVGATRGCPRNVVERERGRAIAALAAAYRRESELARRFGAIGDGETVSAEEVDAAIDARQYAEAQLGEWSA
jgi:hypothetical protein